MFSSLKTDSYSLDGYSSQPHMHYSRANPPSEYSMLGLASVRHSQDLEAAMAVAVADVVDREEMS